MENIVLKVIPGSLVMKGIHHGNLYFLLGTTVTGDLSVGFSGSKYQTRECTRIWPMSFGHMSKKFYHCLVDKAC